MKDPKPPKISFIEKDPLWSVLLFASLQKLTHQFKSLFQHRTFNSTGRWFSLSLCFPSLLESCSGKKNIFPGFMRNCLLLQSLSYCICVQMSFALSEAVGGDGDRMYGTCSDDPYKSCTVYFLLEKKPTQCHVTILHFFQFLSSTKLLRYLAYQSGVNLNVLRAVHVRHIISVSGMQEDVLE